MKPHKLKAGDLREGAIYRTPTGKLCTLLPPQRMGQNSEGSYVFAYCRPDGTKMVDKEAGFRLSDANATTIGALVEVCDAPPEVPTFVRARGMA